MPFTSALSTNPVTESALDEVSAAALEALTGSPDLAIVFVSTDHRPKMEMLADRLSNQLGAPLLGCTGESIAATGREIEMSSAISLWLGQLPEAEVIPFSLEFTRTEDGGTITGWPDEVEGDWPDGSMLLVLGEPFSFPADLLLTRMNEDRPGIPVVGGMASGGDAPGQNLLVYGNQVQKSGATGVLLRGNARATAVVSQGCRPIGDHYIITKADRNWIIELGGHPTMKQLEKLFNTLATSEQRMVQSGLHIGRVVSEYQDHFEQGDFLVRNVVGVDEDTGALAIGDYVRPGQTVQFHIRDESTADGEMKQLMAAADLQPKGGLLFTCNGRGTRLFSAPHHDAGVIQNAFGDIPLAGFFAQGELGPIGGKNFMHGFTASAVLFE